MYHLQPNSLRGLNALSTITPQALIVSDRLLIAYANTIEPNFNPTTHISSLSIVLLYFAFFGTSVTNKAKSFP